jgi:hypothetical protein
MLKTWSYDSTGGDWCWCVGAAFAQQAVSCMDAHIGKVRRGCVRERVSLCVSAGLGPRILLTAHHAVTVALCV